MRFKREAYEYNASKESLIIDVIFNTGGNIADTLVDWLERKPRGFVRARDSEPRTSPSRAWVKPVVVVSSEMLPPSERMFPATATSKFFPRSSAKMLFLTQTEVLKLREWIEDPWSDASSFSAKVELTTNSGNSRPDSAACA